MPQSSNPAEKARQVLEIFKHLGARPGDALLKKIILSVAAERNIDPPHIAEGIDHGYDKFGWFERGPTENSVRVTKAGFAAY